MTKESQLHWKLSAFDSLSVHELYDFLQLRSEVFGLEQNCLFQDVDGYDQIAHHLMGYVGPQLVAYARCFAAHGKYAEASIGRVVTRPSARGKGLGHLLIEQAKLSVSTLWGPQPVRIGAQARLEKFYTDHGFVNDNKPYMEDGIPHLEMVWTP